METIEKVKEIWLCRECMGVGRISRSNTSITSPPVGFLCFKVDFPMGVCPYSVPGMSYLRYSFSYLHL